MSLHSAPRRFDLVCFGRAAVDFYGEQVGGRLEDMTTFAKYLGGCAANIAVGSARLGLRVAMLTRVGDEHMGRFVRETLVRQGVDVSHVSTDPQRLTGMVVLGIRDDATFPLIFYRENCADMAVTPQDVDPAFIASARALLVTGTHFSTPSIDAASRAAMAHARAAGTKVVLDIDYRPVLWGLTGHGRGEDRFVASDGVSAHLQSIVPECDLVVGTEEEIHIAGGSTDTLAALRRLRTLTEATIVLKRGADGCTIFTGDIPDALDGGVVARGFPIEIFNVLGAGDGFMSGLLRGWLGGSDWTEAAKFANACGALVVSRHGCAPAMPSWPELEDFLARTPARPHTDERLAHIHRTTTGGRAAGGIVALAFDHRRQLADMAAALDVGEERIRDFKGLIAQALLRFDPAESGAIVDERYGRDALYRLTGTGRWLARPVELPGSRPLAFEFDGEAALALRSWPREHVAKCLVSFDADDDPDLCRLQEERLLTLQRACHATERGFLLEVIPPAWEERNDAVAAAVERLYEAGLAPDWWKLPPLSSTASWRGIGELVRGRDAHCRGILILGLDRPDADLSAAFEAARGVSGICGFAIGRTVFRGAAEDFLSGRAGASETVEAIAERYARILRLWTPSPALGTAA